MIIIHILKSLHLQGTQYKIFYDTVPQTCSA